MLHAGLRRCGQHQHSGIAPLWHQVAVVGSLEEHASHLHRPRAVGYLQRHHLHLKGERAPGSALSSACFRQGGLVDPSAPCAPFPAAGHAGPSLGSLPEQPYLHLYKCGHQFRPIPTCRRRHKRSQAPDVHGDHPRNSSMCYWASGHLPLPLGRRRLLFSAPPSLPSTCSPVTPAFSPPLYAAAARSPLLFRRQRPSVANPVTLHPQALRKLQKFRFFVPAVPGAPLRRFGHWCMHEANHPPLTAPLLCILPLPAQARPICPACRAPGMLSSWEEPLQRRCTGRRRTAQPPQPGLEA